MSDPLITPRNPGPVLGELLSLRALRLSDDGLSIVTPGGLALFSLCAPVTFDPPAGAYLGTQDVTLACATAAADIYYTVDGSEPTPGSTPYAGPIAVASNETVRAVAVRAGLGQSAVADADYDITAVVVWDPATKQADLTLSNGGLTGTTLQAANYAYAGGASSQSAGKLYIEYTPSFTTPRANDEAIVGVTDGDPSADNYGLTSSGNFLHNGDFVGPAGAAFNTAEVVRVAVNFETGKGWFGNAAGWGLGGDPAAGTGESFAFAPGTPLAPWMDVYSNAAPAPAAVTLNAGGLPFAYALPAGFGPWQS